MKKLINNRNGFSAVEIVIVMLVIAMLGFAGWYFMNNRNNKNTTPTHSTTPTPVSNKTIPELIAGLKTSIPPQYSSVKVVAVDGTDASGIVASTAYDVPGYPYTITVQPPSGYSIQFHAKDSKKNVPDGVKSAIQSELASAGYMKVSHPKGIASDDTTIFSDQFYASGSAVCEMSFSKLPNDPSATLVCNTKADYAKIAKQTVPFADAYKTGNSGKTSSVFGSPDIKTNKAGTYQYATVPIENAGSFFYKKVGESNWHYFTSSQEGLSCTDIASNPDAKIAFADICNKSAYIN